MTKIIVASILTSYRPLNDRSFNIILNLNEPSREQRDVIHNLHQQSCYVMIKDSVISNEDEEMIDSVDLDLTDVNKSPSKRLRSVLYIKWQQQPEDYKEFKDYYKFKMEQIITHFKNKLL